MWNLFVFTRPSLLVFWFGFVISDVEKNHSDNEVQALLLIAWSTASSYEMFGLTVTTVVHTVCYSQAVSET